MSDTAIKERGETAFTEAGDGVVFRFLNSDLKKIEKALGVGFFNKLADEFVIGTMSFETLEVYMKNGVKKNGKPYTVPDKVLDNLPVALLWDKVFDAVVMSMRGETAQEYMDRLMKVLSEEPDDQPVPPNGPASSLTSSDGPRSGQV